MKKRIEEQLKININEVNCIETQVFCVHNFDRSFDKSACLERAFYKENQIKRV